MFEINLHVPRLFSLIPGPVKDRSAIQNLPQLICYSTSKQYLVVSYVDKELLHKISETKNLSEYTDNYVGKR